MHFELGGEESGDGGENRAQHDTHQQGQDHPGRHGQSGEVKDMPEHASGVDALVHDDGGGGHAHAHHTADGQVGARQQDQARHAQGQEHPGGRLLEDVQNVVHRQQLNLGPLDDGGGDTQGDEDHRDR